MWKKCITCLFIKNPLFWYSVLFIHLLKTSKEATPSHRKHSLVQQYWALRVFNLFVKSKSLRQIFLNNYNPFLNNHNLSFSVIKVYKHSNFLILAIFLYGNQTLNFRWSICILWSRIIIQMYILFRMKKKKMFHFVG